MSASFFPEATMMPTITTSGRRCPSSCKDQFIQQMIELVIKTLKKICILFCRFWHIFGWWDIFSCGIFCSSSAALLRKEPQESTFKSRYKKILHNFYSHVEECLRDMRCPWKIVFDVRLHSLSEWSSWLSRKKDSRFSRNLREYESFSRRFFRRRMCVHPRAWSKHVMKQDSHKEIGNSVEKILSSGHF